jgi:uncharacterized DUF497 family protein
MILGFEWDENKNIINQVKHGVSFETAKRVFSDPMRYESFDWGHSVTEDRWQSVGLIGCNIISVIFTEKNGLIRIISARKADNSEQEEYFYGYGIQYTRH